MEIEIARRNMIEQQLKGSSVLNERVLEAFTDVPRETFVPPALVGQAFADTALPLPCDQHMMSPRNQGLLLQALDLQPDERVLEIGTGSGFLTACMRHLSASVDSLEVHTELANTATETLTSENIPDVSVHPIDAWDWQSNKRYDVIVISASMPEYDPHFEQWLKPQGRLFAVLGNRPVMRACLIRQYAPGQSSTRCLFELEVDPILGFGARA